MPESESPKMQMFWNTHRYLLNSRHETKKDAHREAKKCRDDMHCLARVLPVGGKYYVYLANARPRKKGGRK